MHKETSQERIRDVESSHGKEQIKVIGYQKRVNFIWARTHSNISKSILFVNASTDVERKEKEIYRKSLPSYFVCVMEYVSGVMGGVKNFHEHEQLHPTRTRNWRSNSVSSVAQKYQILYGYRHLLNCER